MANRGRPPKKINLDFYKYREPKLKSEPLDLCLERQIISPEEHQVGMKYKWLYTLKFGSPHIKAHDIFDLGGRWGRKHNDEKWLQAHQQHYDIFVRELILIGCLRPVTDICVHNQYPAFLAINSIDKNYQLEYDMLKKGLARLVEVDGHNIYML